MGPACADARDRADAEGGPNRLPPSQTLLQIRGTFAKRSCRSGNSGQAMHATRRWPRQCQAPSGKFPHCTTLAARQPAQVANPVHSREILRREAPGAVHPETSRANNDRRRPDFGRLNHRGRGQARNHRGPGQARNHRKGPAKPETPAQPPARCSLSVRIWNGRSATLMRPSAKVSDPASYGCSRRLFSATDATAKEARRPTQARAPSGS